MGEESASGNEIKLHQEIEDSPLVSLNFAIHWPKQTPFFLLPNSTMDRPQIITIIEWNLYACGDDKKGRSYVRIAAKFTTEEIVIYPINLIHLHPLPGFSRHSWPLVRNCRVLMYGWRDGKKNQYAPLHK